MTLELYSRSNITWNGASVVEINADTALTTQSTKRVPLAPKPIILPRNGIRLYLQ